MTLSEARRECEQYHQFIPDGHYRHVECDQLVFPGMVSPDVYDWPRAYMDAVNWYAELRRLAKHGVGPLPKPSVYVGSGAWALTASRDRKFKAAYTDFQRACTIARERLTQWTSESR